MPIKFLRSVLLPSSDRVGGILSTTSLFQNDRRDREKMAKDKHDAMEYERQFQRY